jgi:UDP-N-acetylmuramyl pentapeptide synthase
MSSVLVLDLTHGGEVLAREYAARGWQVTALDIYRLGGASQLASLRAAGITCLTQAPAQDFDLAVVPVHAPSTFLGEARCGRVITHHEAVGDLTTFPVPVVEVTGTKGKTSTCFLLAEMLARTDPPCLLLSSAGLIHVGAQLEVLVPNTSITPASILRASRMLDGYQSGVFEVSLGGSGRADVGVITSMEGEYLIAAHTRTSFEAKARIIRCARRAVAFPKSEESRFAPLVPAGVKILTFGPDGDVDIEVLGRPTLGRPVQARIRLGRKEIDLELNGDYLCLSYLTAFRAAAAAALLRGLSAQDITTTIAQFHGVKGRGELEMKQGGWMVTDRNPGVSAASIEWQVRAAEAQGARDIAVLVDPVNRKVCEKLDLKAIAEGITPRSSVKEVAVVDRGREQLPPGMVPVQDVEQMLGKHEMLLQFIKEGYQ